jgi:hypothetical protein
MAGQVKQQVDDMGVDALGQSGVCATLAAGKRGTYAFDARHGARSSASSNTYSASSINQLSANKCAKFQRAVALCGLTDEGGKFG